MKTPPSRRDAACRFVALGDALTEGVGDPDRRLPHGVRGWADRVAEGLAVAAPGWEYANLARRDRRLSAMINEQLPLALEYGPALVSLTVGEPDFLVPSTRHAVMIERFEFAVSVLAETGATVVLFTSPVISRHTADDRVLLYNTAVRRIAAAHGAVLIDPWHLAEFGSPRMWSLVHSLPSRTGHARLAKQVLGVLGVAGSDEIEDLRADETDVAQQAHADGAAAMLVRGFRSVLTRPGAAPPGVDDPLRQARWPELVRVPARGGLRSLAVAGPRPTTSAARLSGSVSGP